MLLHRALVRRSQRGLKLRTRLLLAVAVLVAFFVAAPETVALAFNGYNSAQYADYWVNGHNSNYRTFDDDCANFVSQSLHDPYMGGGYSYVNAGQTYTDDHNWWMQYLPQINTFQNSNSWSRAQDLYNFLLWTYPGGVPEGTAHTKAQQQATYTPDNMVTGDVLFYDWTSDGHIDHTAIQVGIGHDATIGIYGNYVDQHTPSRYHEFWSLATTNSKWPTTTIHFMHINAANG